VSSWSSVRPIALSCMGRVDPFEVAEGVEAPGSNPSEATD